MDDVTLKKMESLRRCIERIESKQPFSVKELLQFYGRNSHKPDKGEY